MTLNEFRFWVEGLSIAIKDAPTSEQWEIILKKLRDVSSISTIGLGQGITHRGNFTGPT